MARPSEAKEWTQGDKLNRICGWVSDGLSDKQIAHNIGIAESTFYEWQKKYPEFATVLSEAKKKPKLELENAMYKLATGQMYVEEVRTSLDPQGQRVTKIDKVKKQLPPNAQIQMFLARAWMPEKYKDEQMSEMDALIGE